MPSELSATIISFITTTQDTRGARRKAKTVGAIRDAANDLFFGQGVQRTTIDEIAAAADVSVGSIYFHFKSKEGVYLALVERALEINEQYMASAEDDPSPLQRVLNAADAYTRFHLERPEAFRLIALRILEPSTSPELGEAEARIADRVERLVGRVRDDLAEAIDAGEVVATDPDAAMRFLWGAWNGVIALSLRQDRLRVGEEELLASLKAGKAMIRRGLAT